MYLCFDYAHNFLFDPWNIRERSLFLPFRACDSLSLFIDKISSGSESERVVYLNDKQFFDLANQFLTRKQREGVRILIGDSIFKLSLICLHLLEWCQLRLAIFASYNRVFDFAIGSWRQIDHCDGAKDN